MGVPGTVLLVESDEKISRNVHAELERRGHLVLDGNVEGSTHDLALSIHPDLILLDVDMPNALPQRIVNEIKRDDRTSRLPVLLLGETETLRNWVGMHDTIEKPFVANTLVNRVETGLELYRLRQQVQSTEADNDVGGYIDPLTGLLGARRLRDELSHQTATVQRYGGHVSIVLFDLDRFESVNQVFGQESGDFVLCEVGQRLQADVRTSDLVGRWRADQFMAILPCTNATGASFIAERFRQILCELPVRLPGGATVGVTASFGCAEATDVVEIVQMAESAIGTAKRRGRNGVFVAPTATPVH